MSKYGYRTESFSGSGIRDLSEIIQYEMSELYNSDIPEYVLGHFSLSEDIRNELNETLRLRDTGEYPFLIDRNSFNDLIKRTLSDIQKETGKDIRYGLWLTSEDNVRRYLADGGSIDRYPVSDVILSDLGPEGRLYAYETVPQSN